MSEGLSDGERHTWRSFLSTNVRLLERLDHELQRRSQLSLTDYEILAELSFAEDQRLRMSGLAERVLVSRSRLTYRVDRLEGLGYVAREECEDDRRGLFAILTDAGADAFAQATPGHLADVRRWFFASMSRDEQAALGRVMSRVDASLPTS
jgi:DNA-binding MarR family transcriptional regulator